jgi:hypothetical protein
MAMRQYEQYGTVRYEPERVRAPSTYVLVRTQDICARRQNSYVTREPNT